MFQVKKKMEQSLYRLQYPFKSKLEKMNKVENPSFSDGGIIYICYSPLMTIWYLVSPYFSIVIFKV